MNDKYNRGRRDGHAAGFAEALEMDKNIIEAATRYLDEMMSKGEVSAEAEDDLVTLLADREERALATAPTGEKEG